MMFHASISARDPRHVADVIAEIWNGHSEPFPPVAVGSWAALADDDRGTMIEVYPLGTIITESEGDADAVGLPSGVDEGTATHLAIGSNWSVDAVLALAAREGWSAKYRKRGDIFGVIEFWVENRLMIEVLTPNMQAEHLSAFGSREAITTTLSHGPGFQPLPARLN